MWCSELLLLRENLCICDCPPFCGLPLRGGRSWLYCVPAPLTHFIVVSSLYLSCEKSSSSLQVILIYSGFINACNLGGACGRGELRVFPLHHLGHCSDRICFWLAVVEMFDPLQDYEDEVDSRVKVQLHWIHCTLVSTFTWTSHHATNPGWLL